jgi:hypothetical protein
MGPQRDQDRLVQWDHAPRAGVGLRLAHRELLLRP